MPEYAGLGIRELYEPPYRILYRVDAAVGVLVIAVRHAARRLPRTPPG